jgi:hypothetical protein
MKERDSVSRGIGAALEFATGLGIGGVMISNGSRLMGSVIILAGVGLAVYTLLASN